MSIRDRFDILLEKRLSGVAGLTHIMVYGKSQIILPAGAVKPDGWSREQMREDLRKGYVGYYDKINSMTWKKILLSKIIYGMNILKL